MSSLRLDASGEYGTRHVHIVSGKTVRLRLSPTEIASVMMQHFAKIEGDSVPLPSDQALVRSTTIPTSYSRGNRNLANIMHKRALTASIVQAPSRAPGPDGINNNIRKATPQPVTGLRYPLLFKTQLHAEEPMSFKGGEAADIVKQILCMHLRKLLGVFCWKTI